MAGAPYKGNFFRGPAAAPGEQVRHVISELLTRQHVHDEVISGHTISITEVRMSPDLSIATVFVKSLLGADEAEVLSNSQRALSQLLAQFDIAERQGLPASFADEWTLPPTAVTGTPDNGLYVLPSPTPAPSASGEGSTPRNTNQPAGTPAGQRAPQQSGVPKQ